MRLSFALAGIGCADCGLSFGSAGMYHVVVRNDRTGTDTYMTATPVTHVEGVTIMRKLQIRRPAHTRALLVDAAASPRSGSDLPPGGLGASPHGFYSRGHAQRTFNPVDYFFAWTPPKDPRNHFDVGWYTWDETAARVAAKADRDAEAKRYTAMGYKVRKFTHASQRITRGGVGSGHPEVDFIVPVFGFDADEN